LFTAQRKWAKNKTNDLKNKQFDENELSNLSAKSFSSSDHNNKISDQSRYEITIKLE